MRLHGQSPVLVDLPPVARRICTDPSVVRASWSQAVGPIHVIDASLRPANVRNPSPRARWTFAYRLGASAVGSVPREMDLLQRLSLPLIQAPVSDGPAMKTFEKQGCSVIPSINHSGGTSTNSIAIGRTPSMYVW
jgi:hypothetical protein